MVSSLYFRGHTLYLFTYNDLKTILLPSVIFAVFNAPVLCSGLEVTSGWLFRVTVKSRIWTWLNLLSFCLHNQRLASAISEDAVNKPWRLIPSRRFSQRNALHLLLTTYPVTFTVSAFWGGLRESFVLMALNYCSIELGGADSNFLLRNFLNACGFVCYAAGALEVVTEASIFPVPFGVGDSHGDYDGNPPLEPPTKQWLFLVGLIVISTIHAQDLRDRIGDSLRQRHTLPILLGKGPACWTIIIPIAVWSLFGPRFWDVGIVGYASVCGVGLLFAVRTLILRSAEDDRVSFRLWSLWMIAIYTLPLARHLEL
ncbi:hypothetical protein ACLMJK_002918 [Lecanora helva]